MADYAISFKLSALRELEQLPAPTGRRIFLAIQGLATTPRPRGGRKLSGSQASYRLRVGDSRVLYR